MIKDTKIMQLIEKLRANRLRMKERDSTKPDIKGQETKKDQTHITLIKFYGSDKNGNKEE